MKNNSSIVQIVVLVVCVIGIVLGVLFFSGKITLPWDKEKKNTLTGQVTVWGVLPYQTVKPIFDALQVKNKGLRVTYIEKTATSIQSELVDALSAGKGPDIFMMGPGQVAQNINRLSIVPYTTYPDTIYKSTFADIGNDFLTDSGILAFPFFIDPMVMYYNRDILSSNFIVNPPTTWEELAGMIPTLTKKDDAAKISQATVALGTTNNTSYTKDILVLRMLQAGNPLVQFKNKQWTSVVDLNDTLQKQLSWLFGFSNPTDPNYSWNQSMPQDRDYFTAGNLAIYFGYPSEAATIRAKNPNLNFAMTSVPQLAGTKKKVGYGRVYSLGVAKVSKNLPAAIGVVNLMTSKEVMPQLLQNSFYAPARRDLLSDKPRDNAERVTVLNSAIISRAFFDPDAAGTSQLIVNNVNQVNAGKKIPESAATAIISGFRDLVSKLTLPEAPLQ